MPTTIGLLADPNSEDSTQPEYAQNEHRSIQPDFLVLEGVCTHLGCCRRCRASRCRPADLGARLAGRLLLPVPRLEVRPGGSRVRGVPAPTNLSVPPYRFVNDSTILIGATAGSA